MKHTITRTVVSAALAAALAMPAMAATTFDNDAQKQSYAVGASMGKYMAGQLATQQQLGVNADMDMVAAGFAEALKGELALDNDTLVGLINDRAEVLNQKVTLKKSALAKENLEAGRAFMEANGNKEGVTTTESGLQYEVLVQGDGAQPKPEEVVKVHFKGMDIEGRVFIDSREGDTPAQVALINVIDGWNEGIQLMPVGSTYRFTIPAHMAYGPEGKDLITPNSTLVFEIELLETARPGAGGMGHGGMGMGHGAMGGMNMNMGMMGH
ncbi:FKBP-type peptidyl-prolyl cis-trans isomerase [Ferrimonas senticii]|uniref:FKBP-type peptidyl-prolyl cis-trans isomerase n=1 Tax=Ferrimonas senticii TaxID=394566 RepID=UPI00040134BD|nr:FKBP-type peptidyl-prolyl cis-trans isomerase [Ferrimonas senticii]